MKLKQVEKLLKASKAKSQAENSRLAVIRNAQAHLAAEAAAFDEKGRAALAEEDMTGAEIASYGRHQRFVDCAASERRARIVELEPLRLKQYGVLRKALQEEMAWERIASDAQAVARREHEAREEERRELLARK